MKKLLRSGFKNLGRPTQGHCRGGQGHVSRNFIPFRTEGRNPIFYPEIHVMGTGGAGGNRSENILPNLRLLPPGVKKSAT